ncbi:MAG TPA: glycosyltransferase family 39 protein, partial [Steroidobacteraceae bacterium]|nr:glycosyltransferase family 39 protein [Steroidobacteraceae bacterium]
DVELPPLKVAARVAAPGFAILRAPELLADPDTGKASDPVELITVANPEAAEPEAAEQVAGPDVDVAAPVVSEPVPVMARAAAAAPPEPAAVAATPPPSPPRTLTPPDPARHASPASSMSAEVPVLQLAGVSSLTPPPGLPPERSTPPAAVVTAPSAFRWQDLAWLALALFVIIGTGLGIRDPWPADEPRFAAVARDMVLSHEWLFPRVGGDLYQDKPPLFFWLLAIGYTLTGSLKASFLIPSFLAAGGVMFCVYDLGRRLVGRGAGLASAILVCCTLQFLVTMRGAQIDPLLCFMTTFSLYALLRHLLLGPAWGWYALGGLFAGLGVITKGVGFLPMLALIPFFAMRAFRWNHLPVLDAGKGGWRWWLAPLAMFAGICLWFVPMLLAVAAHGPGEYTAYRDEILFRQTVGRYAAAWHHVKGWYYFLVEVIPPLWLPWSLLLFWLVPGFKRAWTARDARVWLPLCWVMLVLLFFSASPGKRGVYVNPAIPGLAIAALPLIEGVLARRGVRIASIAFAALMFIAGLALWIVPMFRALPIEWIPPMLPFVVTSAVLIVLALWRKPVAAFAASLGALAIWFSYWVAPEMNGERSGSDFTRGVLTQVAADEQLALVAYKEQFLLYLDRPTVNFGHRRFLEGPQESFDAAAWLDGMPNRVLLVPQDQLSPCFMLNTRLAGEASGERWYLVRSPADESCAKRGNAKRAIYYQPDHQSR